MAGSVEFKNIIPTKKVYQDVIKHLKSKGPMKGIVSDVKDEIKKKTKKGLDYRNKSFKPLTEIYKKRKSKLGLGSKANLSFTGKMLGAMKTKVISAIHGRIQIIEQPYPRSRIDTRTLSNIHGRGTGRMPKREHMNINKSFEKKMLKKWFNSPILKILRRG